MSNELSAQQKADKRNNEKRKGKPQFAAVRFNDSETQTAEEKRDYIANVIGKHGGTREDALIAAFVALEKEI